MLINLLRKKSFFKKKLILIYILICWNIHAYNQKRIISLVPSITQQIYLLDAKENLSGCTSFCPVDENDNIPIVATAIDVNIEKLVTLEPDLIFVSSLVKPQTIETFEKLGLSTKNIPSPTNFNDICSQFLMIGDLIGKSQKAEEIIEVQKIKLEEIKKQIPELPAQRIFMELGMKPLFTVTPNTFMDDYIHFVGGINIAHDMEHGTITRETVIVRNPDVIFIVAMGMMGQEEAKTWKSYKILNAAKKNQIFILDSNIASLPTPVNFVKTVEKMVDFMY